MNDSESLQGLIDPFKLAKRQQVLQGVIAVRDFARLKKLLAQDSGELHYKVGFKIDEDGRSYLAGELGTEITLRCQRCMQPFAKVVQVEFAASPVQNDAEAKELTGYEPALLHDGKIDLMEYLEDELILALPIVEMHAEDDPNCKGDAVAEYAVQEMENPFQALQKLKLNKKEDT